MNYADFDYLIIATNEINSLEIDRHLQELNPEQYKKNKAKIIFYNEYKEKFKFNHNRNKYQVNTSISDISYIADSRDEVISNCINMGKDFAHSQIDYFFRLTDKYYGKVGNIFLDIGANIGTTSIYVKKKYSNLNVIAFEPSKSNFKMLRMNCILNDTEDINLVNIGLGNKSETVSFTYVPNNPGDCAVSGKAGYAGNDEIEYVENVEIKTLDEYLSENNISNDDIGYIWMDTQGFEKEIFEGAKKLFKSRKIPMLSEFNPEIYIKNNTYDEYVSCLSECYDHFIDINELVAEYKENVHKISDLYEYNKNDTDLFFF